ncbi:hypothetical protein NX059_011275 [Plenodomus lindquistii]|nr:hypothetical protein NX059_011275 [Plenodomus lindquistii]
MPNTVDPAARDKYLLEVTAGPSYDPSTHQQVPVNSPEPIQIDSPLLTAWLHVRILDYHGLPQSSPKTCSYFQHASHSNDRYSISYAFVPKRAISGSELVMGFDYDHSVKDQLPPGTKTALKIATGWLDPGLFADPYAEEPYLYGPALSSWFALSIGESVRNVGAEEQIQQLQTESEGIITEGATGSGASIRAQHSLPEKYKKRRKHFLSPEALNAFTFEEGRMYFADFFNPHLDFANFSLRLPGFSVSVARYVDERTHHLRYVLKEKRGEVGICVIFRLLFGEELEARKKEMGNGGGGEETGEKQGGKEEVDKIRNGVGTTSCTEEKTEDRTQASDCEVVAPGPKPSPGEKGRDVGIISTATGAASDLATSIYGVYAALGFGYSSSSEDSGDDDAQEPSKGSMHTQIDGMDDATVEKYLQARQSSLN